MISGGTGFVGRHFADRMVNDGHEAVVVDPNGKAFMPWGHKYQWIIDDLRRFVQIRKCDDFDLIIHCAAVVGGRLKIEGDPLAVATNLAIDADFFQLARARQKTKARDLFFLVGRLPD